MINEKFAIFILSHGRPNKIRTLKLLSKSGYTGKTYIIIDDEDKLGDEYIKNFGDSVITFSKAEIEKKIDTGDNFGDRRTILHARNACFDIAADLGLDYFLELDDDYNSFVFKKFNGLQKRKDLKNIDDVINLFVEFLKNTEVKTIAFSQNGDHIGGENENILTEFKRKAMNSFFCKTDRRFWFRGTFNEDVNTYTELGKVGNIFITVPQISLNQAPTQTNKGGITDIYKKYGTYVKSAYTVMRNPASVKIGMLGPVDPRIHHNISWKHTVPAIIREEFRK